MVKTQAFKHHGSRYSICSGADPHVPRSRHLHTVKSGYGSLGSPITSQELQDRRLKCKPGKRICDIIRNMLPPPHPPSRCTQMTVSSCDFGSVQRAARTFSCSRQFRTLTDTSQMDPYGQLRKQSFANTQQNVAGRHSLPPNPSLTHSDTLG